MEATATPMISRLKAIRREMGLTQKDLAAKLGIGYAAIRDTEQGKTGVSNRTIRLLTEKCGVNEKWLRYGEGRMFVDERLDAVDKKREAFRQFAVVFGLTPIEKKEIAEYIGYIPEAESAASDAAKRNVARLLKAVERGSIGRTSAHITSS